MFTVLSELYNLIRKFKNLNMYVELWEEAIYAKFNIRGKKDKGL